MTEQKSPHLLRSTETKILIEECAGLFPVKVLKENRVALFVIILFFKKCVSWIFYVDCA